MDKTFIKGLRLIEALASSEEPRGITDLAKELGLTKSNVHRLLATLMSQEYVRQVSPQNQYELTMRIWELGSHVMRRLDLGRVARPAMIRLAGLTGETVHLSVLDGLDVIYVDKIESGHHIRAHTSVGWRAPAYTVATGKAMLAQMPDDYLDRFEGKLEVFTDTTCASLDELREHIRVVRETGYALVPEGEWRDGIAACACAIMNRTGELAGAVGISGPHFRVQPDRLAEIAPHVVEAAHEISRALGFIPRG